MSFAGKVILITGASAGIGEGTALHFAKLGASLALTGRNSENLNKVVTQCQAQGLKPENTLAILGDINSESDRQAMVQKTVDKFGKLDVLVNNAGMADYKKLSEVTQDEYDTMVSTNCRSPLFLTQLAIPHLIKSKGSVVNISSVCSSCAMPEAGAYCVSKAPMDMFTKCLALELAPKGVRVNAISPGTIVSMIARRAHGRYGDDALYQQFLEKQKAVHPLGRVGLPEDVANAVEYLASDKSSFVTGQILYVDGGRNCVSPGIATNIAK